MLDGDLAVSSLTRLHDLLAERSGTLVYHAAGGVGSDGRSQLSLAIEGRLFLCCQRCLEALDYPVDLHSLLEFVDDEHDLTQEELEDDSRDFLPNQQDLDVVELIEDEILLALPTVARHDDCRLPAAVAATDDKVSPFSALAAARSRA
ncbi:MAG: YceD family protein [Candidatus Accumulibacter sp.]|uniref:YceD family protein n=1 Tax=Accumulibacter sp. TaxID=2053492 RepID=UPI00287B4ABA|nr:YceD family protein [Accumulibacter sp.]MDS4012857.1 YceD family protein [Accumulibacter sp.]